MIENSPADKWPEQAGEDFLAAAPRDLDQAEALVEEALLAGAEEAEVYLKTSRTSGVFLQSGFATMTGGNERGVALRVFDGKGRWGHAHASWGEPDMNRRLVREALAALENLAGESTVPLAPAPRPLSPFPSIDGVIDARVLQGSPAHKREIVETALRQVSRESISPLTIALRDGVSRVTLANSRGVKAGFQRTLALLTLTLSQPGSPTLVAEHVGCGIGAHEISEAAEEVLRLREARQEEVIVPQGVLLQSSAAPVLMRWLHQELRTPEPVHAARKIASKVVELVDDPLLPGGVASTPFDAEGFPSRRKVLLKSGIQVGTLEETGGAASEGGRRWVRPSYRDAPAPGGTNLLLQPGRRSGSQMIGGMERGVVLAALEHDARDYPPDLEAQWRGIGWEVRDGRLSGECKRYLFRAAPRQLLEGVVEISSRTRFSLHRSAALGCGELLIHPSL